MSQGAALFDRPKATPQARHLLQFRAGKMTMKKDNWVHADNRPGCAYLYQASDSKVHFCWFERSTGLVEEDYVLVPKQAEFKRVTQCKTGRVFVLKLKDKRLFIWMQDPNASIDSEICDSVNRFIDSPIPPPATNTMADWLGGIRGLSGLSQTDLLALLSMGVGLGSGLSSDTDTSSAHALAATTGRHLNSSRVESPALRTAAASSVPLIHPNNQTPTISTSDPLSSQATGKIRLQDLQNSLANTSGIIRVPIDLTNGITVDSVRDLLDKPNIEGRLLDRLPLQDDEDKKLTASEHIVKNIQSPQFTSAVKSFSEAFNSGELGPLVTQFQLGKDAVLAAKTGDLQALATAMEKSNKPDSSANTNSTILSSESPKPDDPSSKPEKDETEKMDLS